MSDSTVAVIQLTVIIAIIITYFWTAFFVTKERFYSEKFQACRKLIPLPVKYNFWILKTILFGIGFLLVCALPMIIRNGW